LPAAVVSDGAPSASTGKEREGGVNYSKPDAIVPATISVDIIVTINKQ
jgi:hypothetical protein